LASLERGRVPSPRPIAAREIPLVDRVEEMNVLKEAVYKAVHGEGSLIFIHGEAGIGKTRLVRELGAYVRSRGVQVLYGRCPALFRMDGVPPYVLWKEVIKDYLETCTSEQLYRVVGYYPAEVAKLVPELSQKLRVIPQSVPISPEQEQNRLFEAVSQFITNISQETPLLVVLDDLQWTDSSSLLLLHYLARGVQKTPLLLVGAYRSTDIDSKHPLTPVLAELKRERLPQSVSLKRMSLDDISEMIRQILEQDDIPPEFCRMVYEKTKGNPFFAEEVIESLKEEEIIYREENKWKIKEVSKIEFPETVKNVVEARISRLDDECRNVLTMASFIGNDFSFEALREISGVEEGKLLELVDKMFKTGLIKERVIRGEGVCSFADILVRDVVYEEVSPLRRTKLHNVVGCALEKVYAKKLDEHFGELALHFLEGGDKDKALDYFLKAGDRAASIYANDEATSYFQSALDLLEGRDDKLREKGHVLESLGDIKEIVAEYKDSKRFFNEALLLWQRLGEKRKVADMHRRIATLFWSVDGDVERAKDHYDEALKILEAEPESVELGRLYLNIGGMYFQTGYMTEALSWGEKALELAKKLEDFRIMAWSYARLAAVFMGKGDTRKACECAEKALKISLDNNYAENAIIAYTNLGASLPVEEHERRVESYTKAYELAQKVGMIGSISWNGSILAWAHALNGDAEKALRFAEESVALDRKANDLFNLTWSMEALGVASHVIGEWDKSEHCYKEALANAEKAWYQAAAYGNGALGVLYFDKREYVKARECFEKMHQVLEKAGAKLPPILNAYFTFYDASTYIELGEIEKAKTLIDEMRESAVQAKDKGLLASAELSRAIQFRAERKWAESLNLFEKGLQGFETKTARRWSLWWWFARVLCEYAQVYLERDEEGDREKAHNLLNQALEMFQKMGAKKDIEKVEARIAFIETGKEVLKPKLTDYVSTGYADLDKSLYGGIPPNCAVVLTSPSCNERDWLIKSFLETGAKKGEVAFYVTINPGAAKTLADEFKSNFCLFVCNPQADSIVKSAPNVIKLKGVENLTELGIALTSAIHRLDPSLKGPRRICIDLISDVLLQHHAVQTRRWLNALIPELKSARFTTLAAIDPQMHPSEELHAALGLFEGEINIYEKETEKGLGKYLKIKKMSNQKYLDNELLLRREDLQK